jgi:phenylalanyl-tRNA synthetase beta chain
MDIKILDSWLREHLETNAKPTDIAKAMSLTSASIERVEPYGNDYLYHVEVTTNRADMASVRGLAREAATVLPHFGHKAKLLPLKLPIVKFATTHKMPLTVKILDKQLVRRICGIVMQVTQKETPQIVQKRLEAAGIRSLNNLIDITNYVMLEIGHPSHAFDYDRLKNHTLIIRESKKGERIITLDKKEYTLPGGDIVADNGEGEIIDLLGIMGLDNSAITRETKRILFFLDNNDPWKIRKTSMGLAIRTDAAALNEKGVDPELAMDALLRGISLYQQLADATIISDVLDIYLDKPKQHSIKLTHEQIEKLIGIAIPLEQSITILQSLGFSVTSSGSTLSVRVPTWREKDVTIPEDIIEEVARIYGYHNIPTALPPFTQAIPYHMQNNPFYWEHYIKETIKNWGFTEVYTYSMVSEALFEGPLTHAVTLKNPLDQEHMYLRKTITPSLLEVVAEHKGRDELMIFEIANTYHKQKQGRLPNEIRMLAAVIKGHKGDFYHAKGIVEAITKTMGIGELTYKDTDRGGIGASIFLEKIYLGEIEVMDDNLVNIEMNFDLLTNHATLKKTFTSLPKYPSITEDITLVVTPEVKTGDIIKLIERQSTLIKTIALIDMYQDTRTFHIVYQSNQKNLTTEEVTQIREKMIYELQEKFAAKVK